MSDFLAFVECAGCGEAFAVRSPHTTRAKWCSEQCRKAQYSTPCVDCGAPTNGSDGRGPNASLRCVKCNGVVSAQLSRDRWVEHRAYVELLWAEGKTSAEIASAVGYKGNGKHYICHLRQRGYDVPHRRTPEQVARLAEHGRRNLVKARAAARAQRERAAA